MGRAVYEIVGTEGEWRVRHDGRADNVYQTKESAFEAAVAAASLALRQGHAITVTAPASETATGAEIQFERFFFLCAYSRSARHCSPEIAA
jgi:hypothetical protein